MYLYFSLVERKEAEFYHNIDRRRYLVRFKWLIFIAFPVQFMMSLLQAFALPQFQIHVNCESWWSKRLKNNWCQDIFFWRWVAVKYWDPVKSLLTCFLDNDYFHSGLSFNQKCKKYTSANFLVFRDCPEDNLWSLHCLYQIKCALTFF